jgi:hypothetical protein
MPLAWAAVARVRAAPRVASLKEEVIGAVGKG